MLFDIIYFVVFVVVFSIGGMVLFVLYKRYCAESKHYGMVEEDSSAKESRNQLYPVLDNVDGSLHHHHNSHHHHHTNNKVVPAVGNKQHAGGEINLNEQRHDDAVSSESVESKDTEKITIPFERQHDAKAVENDYVVPSDLGNPAVAV